MNLELGGNARICRQVLNSSSRERSFSLGSPSCLPARRSRLTSKSQGSRTYDPVSRQEHRRRDMADSMRTVLSGLCGRELLNSLDNSALHALMALQESGRSDMIHEALAATREGLEWRISIRQTDG